ncbi:MAG: sigma-70 family RNA polymerase sigma factor [Kofleriaceae bacterium]
MTLAAAFRAHLSRTLADAPELEPLLASKLAQARAAWPATWISDDELIRGLAERAPNDADPIEYVRTVHADDLYLALACGAGASAALDAFEVRYFSDVDAAIRQRCGSVPWISDFKQALREKLFVGSVDRRPRILAYAGLGPLRGWLRVIVLRDLINRQTRVPKEQPVDHDELAELSTEPDDPALRLFKQRYAPQFTQAFIAALAALSPRDRDLLKQRFVDGLTLEQLATAHTVDRATVVRRLARARATVLSDVRSRLVVSTALPASEISSLMRHVRSDLQITLTQLLG